MYASRRIVYAIVLAILCRCSVSQPVDSEGAAFSVMPEYVQWVTKRCGDPATTKAADCLALKDKLCGKRDTSEVLCLPDDKTPPTPQARFKSASRYTRVTYLRCSLLQLSCATDRETYDGPARSVDPQSIAAWVQYIQKGCGMKEAPSDAGPNWPAECFKLSGDHCSQPNVKCSKEAVEFLDSSKKVVLRGMYDTGLAYLK